MDQAQTKMTAMRILRAIALGTLTLTAATLVSSCATTDRKYDYAATTNPVDETKSLDQKFDDARKTHVPVLSPSRFTKAEEHLANAKALQGKGANTAETLAQLGYARASLEDAMANADAVRGSLPDVLKAREEAMTARAPEYFKKDFAEVDETLRDRAKSFEKGDNRVSVEERGVLQRKYMGLELSAIQRTQLGEAKSIIDNANNNNAKKYAPQSLADAEAKFNSAVAVIAADRHRDDAIKPAADAATTSAKKLDAVMKIVKNAKGKSPEAIALEINKSNEMVDQQQKALAASSATISGRDAVISDKNATIAGLASANRRLSANERLDKSIEEARKLFPKEEAEAYRQGDKLLLRFKNIQFASGRADLPSDSLATLAKAKDVIAMLDAKEVVVQGHTDSVGGKATNQKLSEKRADSVAQYFLTQDTVKQDAVQVVGYGYSKPLTSNKTANGRAQNRRIDLVITPAAAKDSVAE